MSTDEVAAREKIRGRVLLVVVLTVFLDLVGFGITIPLMPFYVTKMVAPESVGLVTGLLIGSYSLAQALASPVMGRLSDRYGRRAVILVSLAGNVASMIIFAFAAQSNALSLLFTSRLLAGATAGNLGACQAAIADVTDKSERAAAMGKLGAGIGLGMVFGPFIGGQTEQIAPWAPPVAAASMAFLDLVLAALLMPETRKIRTDKPGQGVGAAPATATGFLEVVKDQRILLSLLLYFLTFTSMTCLNVAFPLLSKDRFGWKGQQVGYMFAVFGVLGIVIQGFLMKPLARRFREVSMVMTVAVVLGAGMLVAAFSVAPWMLVLGNVLIGIAISVNNPSISSIASQNARSDQQGAVLGYAQSAGSWARTIWPPIWGFLYGHLSPMAPFWGAAISAFAMVFVAGMLRKEAPPPVSLRQGAAE